MVGLKGNVKGKGDGFIVRDLVSLCAGCWLSVNKLKNFGYDLGRYLCYIPLYLILCQPLFASGVPVFMCLVMSPFVKVLPVLDSIMMPAPSRLDDGLHSPNHGSSYHRSPSVDWLQDDIWVGGSAQYRCVLFF